MRIRSYIAKYHAVPPHKWMIGGVKESESSRFGLQSDAMLRLEACIDINGGKEYCDGEVVPSYLPPESFPHCEGALSQVIGGRCFTCGAILTERDARGWHPRSLYRMLTLQKIPIDSHESDLYCPVTEQTTALIKQFYYPNKNKTIFTSQIDGKPWYAVPFSYDPFWIRKARATRRRVKK